VSGNISADESSASTTPQKGTSGTDNPAKTNAAGPPAQCDEFDAMRRAAPDLSRLERYERRAASRRNRAIREFIFIKSLREFRRQAEGMHDDEVVG
jgi:hypothetical protein